MKHIEKYILLFLFILLLTTCDKFDTLPLTKVRTLEVTPDAVTAIVVGKIIELSGIDNLEHGFCYATHNAPTINDQVVSLGKPTVGEFTAILSNLSPGELYYVRAFCKDGTAFIYGDALQFSTSDGNVSFQSCEIIYTSPTNARVYVNVSADGGATITSRGVVWSTNQNPTIENNHSSNGTGIGSWISILSELTPSTNYYLKPYAINAVGTFYGDEVTFKTLAENTVIDIEGNIYNTITIDTTTWMAENLKVTQYNDKTLITTGLNNSAWEINTTGAYTVYPHESIDGLASDEEVAQAYGYLYNWYAVNSEKGLCPVGWRTPTDEEWTQLTDFIATSNVVNIGNQIKSCRQVDTPIGGDCATSIHPRWDMNSTHYGTDNWGFSAYPGGMRYYNGTFLGIGSQAYFWTSTRQSENNAWYRGLNNDNGGVSKSVEEKRMGFSVRCVKVW